MKHNASMCRRADSGRLMAQTRKSCSRRFSSWCTKRRGLTPDHLQRDTQECRGWARLPKKGGKEQEAPCHHHKLEAFLDEFSGAAGNAGDTDGPLLTATASALTRTGILGGGHVAPHDMRGLCASSGR